MSRPEGGGGGWWLDWKIIKQDDCRRKRKVDTCQMDRSGDTNAS